MPPKNKFHSYCEAVIVGEYTFSRDVKVWGDMILGVYRAQETLEREYNMRMIGTKRRDSKFCFYRSENGMELIGDGDDINPFNFHAFWKETDPNAEHWFRFCHENRGFPNLVFYALNEKYESRQDERDIDFWILHNMLPAYHYLANEEDIDRFIYRWFCFVLLL